MTACVLTSVMRPVSVKVSVWRRWRRGSGYRRHGRRCARRCDQGSAIGERHRRLHGRGVRMRRIAILRRQLSRRDGATGWTHVRAVGYRPLMARRHDTRCPRHERQVHRLNGRGGAGTLSKMDDGAVGVAAAGAGLSDDGDRRDGDVGTDRCGCRRSGPVRAATCRHRHYEEERGGSTDDIDQRHKASPCVIRPDRAAARPRFDPAGDRSATGRQVRIEKLQ